MWCQNVNRRSGLPPALNPKKIKLSERKQKHTYIALTEEDYVAVERNEDLLRKELSRPRPRVDGVDVTKSLVQRTLASRRKAVLDGDRPEDLLD